MLPLLSVAVRVTARVAPTSRSLLPVPERLAEGFVRVGYAVGFSISLNIFSNVVPTGRFVPDVIPPTVTEAVMAFSRAPEPPAPLSNKAAIVVSSTSEESQGPAL